MMMGKNLWAGDIPKMWGWAHLLPYPRLLILGIPSPRHFTSYILQELTLYKQERQHLLHY